MTPNEQLNLDIARRYLALLETSTDPQDFSDILHPDIQQHEFPNRLVAAGIVRDREMMYEGVSRGAAIMSKQTFAIQSAIASGDLVALELIWEGKLAIDLGTLKAGDVMKAHVGTFMQFRDGQIVSQRNYDCFEPF